MREVWNMGKEMVLMPFGGDVDQEAYATLELPAKLDTLKRMVRSHLPMLRLMRKPITVTMEKQPSLPAGEKKELPRIQIQRRTFHYWYDPVDLITWMFNANNLTDKMHFGFAQYVERPVELWHSRMGVISLGHIWRVRV